MGGMLAYHFLSVYVLKYNYCHRVYTLSKTLSGKSEPGIISHILPVLSNVIFFQYGLGKWDYIIVLINSLKIPSEVECYVFVICIYSLVNFVF